jgi:hypothetical protein
MSSTMSSINKKALEQERMLRKLIPKNRYMRREMEDLNSKLEDCNEFSNDRVNEIGALEKEISHLKAEVSK